MSKLYLTIALHFILSVCLFSQNKEVVITKVDGTELKSSIDTEEFERTSIIRIRGLSGEFERLIPREIDKIFLVKEKNTIRSGLVTYFDKNLEPQNKWAFLQVLVDGEVDLFKSYTKEFDNVLSYEGTFKALQQYSVNGVLNEDFQGAFYLAFNGCDKDLDIYNTKFSERDFISIVTEFNTCISPDFQYKEVDIIRKDGTQFSGLLDLELFEEKNIVQVKEASGNFYKIDPKEIAKISFVHINREIRSGDVDYLDRNSVLTKGWYFLDLLVDGEVSLYRSYSREFDYVLEYDGVFKALQEYYVDGVRNKVYQGTFYLAFKACEKNLNVYGIKFSEDSFIDVVKKYNVCVIPDYEFQINKETVQNESEVELLIGTSNAALNIVEDNNNFEESSETFVQLSYKRSFLDRRFYFSSGFSRYRFVWKEKSRTNRFTGFTEVRIPVNIEARTDLEILDLRVYTGFNLTGFITNIDTNGYVSYNLGGSAALNIMDEFNIGVNFNRVLRHRTLQNRDNNFEYKVLNEYSIGFFVRKKLFLYE